MGFITGQKTFKLNSYVEIIDSWSGSYKSIGKIIDSTGLYYYTVKILKGNNIGETEEFYSGQIRLYEPPVLKKFLKEKNK